jgi:Family of unknown function (DUF6011)
MAVNFKSDAKATRAIKAALRKAFPDAAFSVARGGSKIRWTDDGPTANEVKDALIATNVVTTWKDFRNDLVLQVPGNCHANSISFNRYNIAERAAFNADIERRAQEREAREQREAEAIQTAAKARDAAMPKRPAQTYTTAPTNPSAHAVFEQLRQRAEEDAAAADETTERKVRPSYAPPMALEGELLEDCIELGLLEKGDPPIARLWASFASPKVKYRALREQVSNLPLVGIQCRGFQLHAGGERGKVGNILFEAQRTEKGEWQFGPRPYEYDYHNPRTREWGDLVRERERYSSLNYSPKDRDDGIARTSRRIAEIEAQDALDAKALYRRQALRRRVIELAGFRVLDFAGSPGAQMMLAGRLWGRCCRCSMVLSDPVSTERGVGPECTQILARYIKSNAAEGLDYLAFMTGMPAKFITVTIEEVEAEAAVIANAERDALLAAIPLKAGVTVHRVDGFLREDHDVRVIMIVDVADGSNESAHQLAEAIAGAGYCFTISCNITHPVNAAAKGRLFFSEQALFEAAPELRPLSRRGHRVSRRENA